MTDLAWMDTQFFFQCFYLCIGCPGSFCYGWAFSSGWEQGLLSSCGVQASHWWLLLLQRTGSKRKGLSNWGTQDKLLRSLWNPPRSGSQPVSPALTGRFLSPATPGKSLNLHRVAGIISVQFSSVQYLSHVRLFATPRTAARQASLTITNSQNLLKLMSIALVMPSSHLILCRSLLLPPSIFPSIRVFSNESALCIRWPKDWSFSFSISPSNEYSGLVCFRIDWLDLLAVQRTLKRLLQHHSSRVSILRRSAFFILQLSHIYMTTGKTVVWLDGPLLAK